ncbi:TadE/TadG family type IV pilus assembly protein [Lederbergia wuyishanensis]|uniref:Flp pilus assembly protein TadG n=1 Tax=Lederbergia wuyishanensis TaxID=1347903 RepID=A0ABU0D899_9BACI|nr:TadE/TadG family type IV pilus assembly protein [Lederbergia wuyishanensis]MCJ8009236.1 pilus assembly protein [Lederbergia wuyishanensis]MDQ0344631.1 Flp pilus assembly protein TadG [Lederbergia wuyishanensis]
MKSQKGQSLVETALVLPILIMLLFGIVDFGRVFHAYLTLDHAGREAARDAAIGKEDFEINSKITSSTTSLGSGVIPTISPSGKANRPSGTDVTITLKYKIDLITPILGQAVKDIDLENKTVMRVE